MNCLISLINVTEREAAASEARGRDSVGCEVLMM